MDDSMGDRPTRMKTKTKSGYVSRGEKIVNHGSSIHGWKSYNILRCIDERSISQLSAPVTSLEEAWSDVGTRAD